MTAGDWLVRLTIWPAVALGLLAIAVEWGWTRAPRTRAGALWIVGGFLYLLHVGAAFHFVHHWKHAAALEATRRQTFEFTGWNSGNGLFVNYAFTALWLGVALLGSPALDRPDWLRRLWHGVFLFIAFNGAVVFTRGASRGTGVLLFALFCLAGLRHWRARRLPAPEPPA